jgi:hypothetical protein
MSVKLSVAWFVNVLGIILSGMERGDGGIFGRVCSLSTRIAISRVCGSGNGTTVKR